MKKNFLLFALLFCIGCSDSSTNSGPGTSVSGLPKAGSSFTFTSFPIDTNGVRLTNEAYLTVDSVLQSGFQLLGKSNVIHVRTTQSNFGGSSEVFFSFDASGDVFLIDTTGENTEWNLLPFGSKVPRYTDIDSIYLGQQITEHDTVAFDGTETLTINGSTLQGQRVKLASHATSTFLGNAISSESLSYFTYCPTISYFIHLYNGPFNFGLGKIEGRELILASYVLK